MAKKPPNHGKPWTASDVRTLEKLADGNNPDARHRIEPRSGSYIGIGAPGAVAESIKTKKGIFAEASHFCSLLSCLNKKTRRCIG
jgi:hypothetical protein